MAEITNEQQLSHLCGVAGWYEIKGDYEEGEWFDADHEPHWPLINRDDAHALLSAVLAKLGENYRSQVQRHSEDLAMAICKKSMNYGLLTMSAALLCAAMWQALPECPRCEGIGLADEDLTGKKWPCPACGGLGKARK